MKYTRGRIALLALTLGLGMFGAGCFNPFDPLVSSQRAASIPAPAPNSPANVVKLFAWCWLNRDPSLYSEIFTDDYRFQFAPNDSAGNPYRDSPWIREYELSSALHMFSGGTDRPPASDIKITISELLVVNPDPRPGKLAKWHRSVRTPVDLKITFDQNGSPEVNSVAGYALFFVVRGDSAVIPPELVAQGFGPDSTRWWIERWEDETAGATGSPAIAHPVGPGRLRTARPASFYLPPGRVSFGQIKASRF
jgi:hypothetical protein